MLTIVKVKPTLGGRSCYLELSNQHVYKLPIDWVILNKYRSGADITNAQAKRLRLKSLFYRLNEYALLQIAISPKTVTILRQKLILYCRKHRLKAPRTIAKIITQIQKRGLTDEVKYIEYYTRRNHRKSVTLQKYELSRLGVSRLSIDRHLHFDPQQTSKSIQQILIKKKVTPLTFNDIRQKNRILGAILRKGFSLSEAKSAIDDYLKNRYNKLP